MGRCQRFSRRPGKQCQSEVPDKHGPLAVDYQVCRLHVTVNQLVVVRVRQRFGSLNYVAAGQPNGQRTLLGNKPL
jgi:hypothetical protein